MSGGFGKAGPSRRPRRGPESGSAAVEFAIIGPLFMILLIGILVWGQYFWIAHSLQQIANDSARAALAGLDPVERQSLARAALEAEVADNAALRPAAASVAVESLPDRMTVSVAYDSSQAMFRVFEGLVPTPPRMVVRQASVRLGGY